MEKRGIQLAISILTCTFLALFEQWDRQKIQLFVLKESIFARNKDPGGTAEVGQWQMTTS